MKYQRLAFRCLFALVLAACLVSPANAVSVAVVGGLDKFLTSTIISASGQGKEEAWVSSVLGFAVTINYKDEAIDAGSWQRVNGSADHWAYALATDPAHYLLNLGVGNSGADTHYLFENLAELSWAVIDLSETLAGQTNLDFNFGRVSHISEMGGGTVDLSEPRSIGLLILGLALFGLLVARKPRNLAGYPA